MIIVQTPLRVSFFGGGTDFPAFYHQEGGAVLSAAIDKFIFVTIKERFDCKIRVGYTSTEMVDSIDELKHSLIREALRKTGIERGVEITTMGDIPSEGSGLGSSSTVTIGALHAMYAYNGEIVPANRLAEEACEIEIDILGSPIGKQDQYIVAHGGLRFIEFRQDGTIEVEKVHLGEDTFRSLNNNFMLFFTGISRQANTILKEQSANIEDRTTTLSQLKDMAFVARHELENNNIDALGELLHQSWVLKKQLAGAITTSEIDEMYTSARQAGAIGGKITGAGGGGFLLLYCPFEKQNAVRATLHGLQELTFKIEMDGTKVIFNYR